MKTITSFIKEAFKWPKVKKLETIVKYVEEYGDKETLKEIYGGKAYVVNLTIDDWKTFEGPYDKRKTIVCGFTKIAISCTKKSKFDNPELMILRKDNNEWLKIGLTNIESQTDEVQKQLFDKIKD